MKDFLKWSLILTGIVVALVWLFYFVENRRGARIWAETKAYLESEGETLEFSELLAARPPDDQNFCAIPLIASMADFEPGQRDANGEVGDPIFRDPEQHRRVAAMILPQPGDGENPPTGARFQNGDLPDFAGWAALFRESSDHKIGNVAAPPAEQILFALKRFDPEIAEMTAAVARPGAVFETNWPEDRNFIEFMATQTPWAKDTINLSKLLALRAEAAIAVGDPQTARESLAIGFRLGDAVAKEPTLIPNMVAMTARAIALRVVWYGLRQRAWEKEDLEWLEQRLDSFDADDAALNAFRSEMIVLPIYGTEFMKQRRLESAKAIANLGGSGGSFEYSFFSVMPGGYWDQGMSEGCRFIYDGIIKPYKSGDYATCARGSAVPHPKRKLRNLLIVLSAPSLEQIVRHNIRAKVLQRLASTACALERYYLDQGRYPDGELSALVPAYRNVIPRDPIDGAPLRYRPWDDGRYRIYSVGSNLADDGGTVEFKSDGRKPDYETGDWVWGYVYPERDNVPE